MNELHKSLEYAYPTSDTAALLGFPTSGCWIVTTRKGSGLFDEIDGTFEMAYHSKEKAKAMQYFKRLKLPISKASLSF